MKLWNCKKFKVAHDHSSMKVGTDAILLGAWIPEGLYSRILDVGTGSGIITLCLAQRFERAVVLGIDIHEASVKESAWNFEASPWKDRMESREQSFQSLSGETFDLIVSNPPYFQATTGTLSPNEHRRQARHDQSLNLNELLKKADELLSENGKLGLVIPYNAVFDASGTALTEIRRTVVYGKEGKSPERLLLLFEKGSVKNCQQDDLIIRLSDGSLSEEYRKLTEDFYL